MNCGQVQSGPRGALGTNLAFPARPRPTGLLPSSFRLSYLTLANIGSSARCYRITTPATPSRQPRPDRRPLLAFCLRPSAFRYDPSLTQKHPSLSPEYPPLSRNIPPYPRISLLSFSIATNSSTATSVSPLDLLQNRHPDNQPLAHETIMTSHEPDRPSAARQVSSFSASV